MEQKGGIRLDDVKGSGNGLVQGSYVDKMDEQWIGSTAGPVAAKYQGTAADKQDMSVLGRDQVLRVRKDVIPVQLSVPTDGVMHSATSASSLSSVLDVHLSAHGRSF